MIYLIIIVSGAHMQSQHTRGNTTNASSRSAKPGHISGHRFVQMLTRLTSFILHDYPGLRKTTVLYCTVRVRVLYFNRGCVASKIIVRIAANGCMHLLIRGDTYKTYNSAKFAAFSRSNTRHGHSVFGVRIQVPHGATHHKGDGHSH